LLRAQPLYAAGLRNLAVLRLYPLWLEQAEPVLDPPCRAVGTFSDLEQMFQPSIALGNAHGWTHLGRVLWLQARCDEAVDAWERAWTIARDATVAFELIRVGQYTVLPLGIRQKAAEDFYRKARGLTKIHSDKSALGWLRRAFDLAPHHKYASAIAQIYRKVGDTKNARHVWQRLADLTPDTDAEYWWAVGELASMDGNWNAAARAYAQGGTITAEPYEFWTAAGSAWLRAHELDAALAAYEQAYQMIPNAWACILLGNVYRARRQYTEALRWYAEALTKSPQDPEPYFRFGEIYYLLGEYARALQYLGQSLRIDPNYYMSMYYIAKIFRVQGDTVNAERWMLDALERIPWYDMRAAWWIELGDWRLEWRDCDGARKAYINAREMLIVEEQTIQKRIKKLTEICIP